MPVQTLNEEIQKYVAIRNQREQLEEILKPIKAAEKEQAERLYNLLEAENTKTVNHDLGRFTRVEKVRGIVTDAEKARQYFSDHEMLDDMTKVEWKTAELNKFAKGILKEGQEFPEGVSFMEDHSITFTRSK